MKQSLFILFVIVLSSCTLLYCKKVGHGFYTKPVAVENGPDHWEKYAHYEFYYFKGRNFGLLDGFSFSSDDKYAVYTKSEDGKLYLFNLKNEVEYFSGVNQYCYPSDLDWSASGILKVQCLMSGNKSFYTEIDLTRLSD